jgi:hypothetical protein
MRVVRMLTTLLAASLLLSLLAACGSGSEGREPEPGSGEKPKMQIVDVNLASRSDEIAEFLEAGDVCHAPGFATELANDVSLLTDGDSVPPQLQGELLSTAAHLARRTDALALEAGCPAPLGNTPELPETPRPSGKPLPAASRQIVADRARAFSEWIRENSATAQ